MVVHGRKILKKGIVCDQTKFENLNQFLILSSIADTINDF